MFREFSNTVGYTTTTCREIVDTLPSHTLGIQKTCRAIELGRWDPAMFVTTPSSTALQAGWLGAEMKTSSVSRQGNAGLVVYVCAEAADATEPTPKAATDKNESSSSQGHL